MDRHPSRTLRNDRRTNKIIQSDEDYAVFIRISRHDFAPLHNVHACHMVYLPSRSIADWNRSWGRTSNGQVQHWICEESVTMKFEPQSHVLFNDHQSALMKNSQYWPTFVSKTHIGTRVIWFVIMLDHRCMCVGWAWWSLFGSWNSRSRWWSLARATFVREEGTISRIVPSRATKSISLIELFFSVAIYSCHSIS